MVKKAALIKGAAFSVHSSLVVFFPLSFCIFDLFEAEEMFFLKPTALQ